MSRLACNIKHRKNRGMVLPTVLWITVLAITVSVSYASAVHLNTRSADNIKTSMRLKYDAIAGVYLALDRVLTKAVDETARYRISFNDSELDIEISPEHLKTSVNTANASEIRAAMVDAGVDPDTARMLAARVIDWRDADHDQFTQGMEDAQYFAAGRDYGAKDGRLEDLSELLLIADFGRETFSSLSDHLTVYDGVGHRIYSITATSSRDGHNGLYVTRAIVQITGQYKPYQILKWRNNHG